MTEMNRRDEELDLFLKTIRLKNGKNEFTGEGLRKFNQIREYSLQVASLLKKMSKKRTLTFVDCGAGNCYLSFYLNYLFRDRKIRFICIDYNSRIMKSSEERAMALGFGNMEFLGMDIRDFSLDERPDLVYSLHACDTATDLAVYTGIVTEARHILTVSCCQRSVYGRLKSHPLVSLTANKVYKERLADMLSDTMRSQILETRGYDTDIFEFSSSKYTDKNVMLRASAIPAGKARMAEAARRYGHLKQMFHLEPELAVLLRKHERESPALLDVS